jgi:hypothetical protein
MRSSRPVYKLKDIGCSTMKKIYCGNDHVGWVYKEADGFRAKIAKLEVHSPSQADAFQRVVAKHTGQDITSIFKNSDNFLDIKKVQAYTEMILSWLKDHCRDGVLSFTNTDLAQAIGKEKPDRVLGSLMSRLDFCCYLAGLPALGCAADRTFEEAWNKGEWPLELMKRVAKAHRWTAGDFERIRHETQRLTVMVGHLVWKDELAKHKAHVMEWAHKEDFPG